jgi:hypothetical protein
VSDVGACCSFCSRPWLPWLLPTAALLHKHSAMLSAAGSTSPCTGHMPIIPWC